MGKGSDDQARKQANGWMGASHSQARKEGGRQREISLTWRERKERNWLAFSSPLSPLVWPSFTWSDRFLYFQQTFCVQLIHWPDDRDSMHLCNIGLLQWNYMALYPRKLLCSYSPPWEPEISHITNDVHMDTSICCAQQHVNMVKITKAPLKC
jgi:hypothetical protein